MRLVSMLSKVCKNSSTAACALTIPPACWYHYPAAAGLRNPQVHGPARYWLKVQGSFTRALQQRCQQSFHVEVASEGFALPRAEEARKLNIPWRQQAWIREVRLCGDGQPWVLARTVIPLACLQGPGRQLRNLGNRPWVLTCSATANGIGAHWKPDCARAPRAVSRNWPGARCFTLAGRAASIR